MYTNAYVMQKDQENKELIRNDKHTVCGSPSMSGDPEDWPQANGGELCRFVHTCLRR